MDQSLRGQASCSPSNGFGGGVARRSVSLSDCLTIAQLLDDPPANQSLDVPASRSPSNGFVRQQNGT